MLHGTCCTQKSTARDAGSAGLALTKNPGKDAEDAVDVEPLHGTALAVLPLLYTQHQPGEAGRLVPQALM